MLVLLIGGGGLVGRHLRDALAEERLVVTYHRAPVSGAIELDLDDLAAVDRVIRVTRPDVTILAAAEAQVERCEKEPALTRRTNVESARAAAEASRAVGSALVVFSSEYVFDGTRGPYREDDPVAPLNEYGRQKVELESFARSVPAHLICRTSAVFGWDPAGKNFVLQLVRRLRAGEPFDVPSDQVVTPTYGPELARSVTGLVRRGAKGTFNVVGPLPYSRTDFARLVARTFDLREDLIRPRATAELSLAARRPGPLSGLRDEKLAATLGGRLSPITDALEHMRRTEPAAAPRV